MTLAELRKEFRSQGDAKIAEHSQRFFKTGEGEYGAGDRFLGIRVPVVRKFAKQHTDMTLRQLLAFLKSPYHEERLLACIALAALYKRGDENVKREVYESYVANLDYVNNWDMVDGSAHLIVGPWLQEKSRKPLYSLAKRKDLWRRRVAIMSTYHYIRLGDFDDTLGIAEILLGDDEDLIHKATGWMLREVGNRDRPTEEAFLKKHYLNMPRTMLRYAIEKFPESRRKAYLNGKV